MTIDDEERQATQEVMSAFERSAAMWRQRAEAAEAKLALVDEYGQSQWNSGVSGSEFEAGPCETFVEWLGQREELLLGIDAPALALSAQPAAPRMVTVDAETLPVGCPRGHEGRVFRVVGER